MILSGSFAQAREPSFQVPCLFHRRIVFVQNMDTHESFPEVDACRAREKADDPREKKRWFFGNADVHFNDIGMQIHVGA